MSRSRAGARARRALAIVALAAAAGCVDDSAAARLCRRVGHLCGSPRAAIDLSFGSTRAVYVAVDGGRRLVLGSPTGLILGDAAGFGGDRLDFDAGVVGLAAADLDGDGDDEVIVARSDPPRLWISAASGDPATAREGVPEGVPQAIWAGRLIPGGPPRIVVASTLPGGIELFDADLEPVARAPFGVTPSAIAAVDLDGDAALELVVADYSSSSVHLLRGDGAGGLRAAERIDSALLPEAIDVVDLDGDGRSDVLVQGRADPRVWLHRGDGVRGLAQGIPIAVGDGGAAAIGVVGIPAEGGAPGWIVAGSGHTLVAAEVDVDGEVLQRAVGERWDGLLALVRDAEGILGLHAGGATLVDTAQALGFVDVWRREAAGPTAIAAGDLDDDGAPDFVVLTALGIGRALKVWIAGDGGWSPAPGPSLPTTAVDLALADVSGDGLVDVIVIEFAEDDEDAPALRVGLGDGAGGFTFGEATPLPGTPTILAPIARAEAPGSDLVLAYGDDLGVPPPRILGFDGEGAVVGSSSIVGGFRPARLAVVDVDDDGRDDLVAVIRDEGGASLARVDALASGAWADPITIAIEDALPGLGEGLEGRALIVGDVDGDGRVDAVIAGGEASVLVRDLTTLDPGGLEVVEHAAIEAEAGLVVDLDEDGVVDLLLAEAGGASAILGPASGSAELLRGRRGAGPSAPFVDAGGRGRVAVDEGDALGVRGIGRAPSLAPIEATPGGGSLRTIAAGDVDGDGVTDLLVAGDHDLEVLWGPVTEVPTSGVKARALAVGAHLAVVDLDGDPALEIASGGAEGRLVVGRAVDRRIEVVAEAALGGEIVGLFAAPLVTLARADDGLRRTEWALDGELAVVHAVTVGGPTLEPLDVATGDLDGDGEPDLVVVADRTTSVWVAWGRDATSWRALGVDVEGARRAAIGDLDGDGDDELAVDDGDDVYLFDFDGRQALGPVRVGSLRGGGESPGLAIADVDGDGRAEVARAHGHTVDIGLDFGPLPAHRLRFLDPTVHDFTAAALVDLDGDRVLDPVLLSSRGVTFWRSGEG